ncbi:MAG: hypothetical protein R3C59_22135, partial [Planctomycetaceae bacterium]
FPLFSPFCFPPFVFPLLLSPFCFPPFAFLPFAFLKQVVFGLDEGFDLRRAADGISTRIQDGNYTSHELRTVLNHLSDLRTRGVDVVFVRNGSEYRYFFEAIGNPPTGLSYSQLERHGRALDAIYGEFR